MYADRDDARLKPAKANQPMVWCAAIAASLALTGLAILIASKSMGGNYLKAATKTHGVAPSLALTPAPAFRANAPEPPPLPAAVPQTQPRVYQYSGSARLNQPAASAPVRQTSFNDSNYVPRGAVNVLPATRVMPSPANQQQPAKALEIVVVGQQPRRISDFCPFRSGSIEQRNCKQSVNLSSRNTPASTR